MNFKIPTEHGAPSLSIPRPEIPARMDENRARLDLTGIQIGETDGNSFRSEVRKEFLHLAARLNPANSCPGLPLGEKKIILSGHQPLLYHPGIWIKLFILDLLAKETGSVAVNLEVDADALNRVETPFPAKQEYVRVVSETLWEVETPRALESVPAPDPNKWACFMEKGLSHCRALPNKKIARRLEAFKEMGPRVWRSGMRLSQFFTRLRRSCEEPVNLDYLSLPVSAACGTRSFFRFFLHMAASAESFLKSYNAALNDYRIRHKLRYKANPFPDLSVKDGGLMELPFWSLDEKGIRRPVFVSVLRGQDQAERSPFTLFPDTIDPMEADPNNLEATVERLMQGAISIRPKALALTLFFRLFFCDLFIHGIGGAKYDQVADFIINDFFGLTPPLCLVASLTLTPDLGVDGVPEGEVRLIKARQRDMKFKPERYIDLVPEGKERDAFAKIAGQKISLLNSAPQGKKNKRFSFDINALNDKLLACLEPARLEDEKRLKELERKSGEGTALQFREYPFCLFDPNELKTIANNYYSNYDE